MTAYLPVFASAGGEADTLAAYQAVLHRWPVPYEELSIATSFGDTHVVASGARGDPAVILLHAGFAGAIAWYRTAGALSPYYRVFAIDIVGEPNRSRPTRTIEGVEPLTQWFAELTAGLGARHFDLVGSSFGGFAAAHFAMHLPDRVRKLALIGPTATLQPVASRYRDLLMPGTYARGAQPQIRPAAGSRLSALGARLSALLTGSEPCLRPGPVCMQAGLPHDEPWATFFQLALGHGVATTRVCPRAFTTDELRHIRAPTMLLIGEHDRGYRGGPGAAARAARLALPAARIERVPGAHHLAALSNPPHVNARLRWFLESYSTRPDGVPLRVVEPTLLEVM